MLGEKIYEGRSESLVMTNGRVKGCHAGLTFFADERYSKISLNSYDTYYGDNGTHDVSNGGEMRGCTSVVAAKINHSGNDNMRVGRLVSVVVTCGASLATSLVSLRFTDLFNLRRTRPKILPRRSKVNKSTFEGPPFVAG